MKSIIELAKQAGFKDPTPADGYMGAAYDYRDGADSGGDIKRFAALVRNAALDEAAGVCGEYDEGWYVYRKGAAQCATAIRQLKETK